MGGFWHEKEGGGTGKDKNGEGEKGSTHRIWVKSEMI